MSYLPIRVSTLRGDQKISFDLFVLVADKYIHYLRSGDSFEGERLQRLKKKKLKKMFIREESEGSYRNYMTQNIAIALDKNSGKSIEDRSAIVQGAQQAAAEDLMESPTNQVAYASAKEGAGQFVNFLLNENQALQTLMQMDMTDENSIAQHGVAVATTSVALANRIGWKNQQDLTLLTLGALVHDIGHVETGWDIKVDPTTVKGEDRKKYERHPSVGADLVKSMRHFDTTVINIILEHEEMINGQGFPNKLTEKKLDPASIIVATCNALDRYVRYQKLTPQEAGKKLLIEMVGRYPLNYIQALQKVTAEQKMG